MYLKPTQPQKRLVILINNLLPIFLLKNIEGNRLQINPIARNIPAVAILFLSSLTAALSPKIKQREPAIPDTETYILDCSHEIGNLFAFWKGTE